MAKYHINPETGRVNICTATVQECRYGSADDHYTSKEAARKASEDKLTEDLGVFAQMPAKTTGHQDANDREPQLADVLKEIVPAITAAKTKKLTRLYSDHPFTIDFIERLDPILGDLTPRDAVEVYEAVERFTLIDSYYPQRGWSVNSGEPMFKRILDNEGNSRGSIERRDGFYILGARDRKTEKLIHFEDNSFETANDAVEYFQKWSRVNHSAITGD